MGLGLATCSGVVRTRALPRAQPHSRSASGMQPHSSAMTAACASGTCDMLRGRVRVRVRVRVKVRVRVQE